MGRTVHRLTFAWSLSLLLALSSLNELQRDVPHSLKTMKKIKREKSEKLNTHNTQCQEKAIDTHLWICTLSNRHPQTHPQIYASNLSPPPCPLWVCAVSSVKVLECLHKLFSRSACYLKITESLYRSACTETLRWWLYKHPEGFGARSV